MAGGVEAGRMCDCRRCRAPEITFRRQTPCKTVLGSSRQHCRSYGGSEGRGAVPCISAREMVETCWIARRRASSTVSVPRRAGWCYRGLASVHCGGLRPASPRTPVAPASAPWGGSSAASHAGRGQRSRPDAETVAVVVV
eukprot:scaffold921_cov397-Prasinococcus_capsulatus_cf.AAC.1